MLTRSGWALTAVTAALVGGAVRWHFPQLWGLAAACAVAVAAALARRLTGPDLVLERRLDRDRVTVGEPLAAQVSVTNRSRRRTGPLLARERFGPSDLRIELPSVSGRTTEALSYPLPTDRRAVVTVGPFEVERTDALALSSRAQRHDRTVTLWIHPRVHPVVPLAAGLRPTSDGPAQLVTPQATLAFHSLREYVVGDDLRQIHWRSTAHTGTLMVRHNIDASVPSGVVVLDTRAGVYHQDSIEEAIEVAASLVTASARAHLPIRLLTTGGLLLDDHRADQQAFLDQLAAVVPDEDGRLVDVGRRLPRRRHGVALALVTGESGDQDLAALGQLCRGFSEASVIRVRPQTATPIGGALAGVEVLDVDDATEFARRWGPARW